MSETCSAALNVRGEHFPCDTPTDERGRHDGWAHSSRAAAAIWSGGEVSAWDRGWVACASAVRHQHVVTPNPYSIATDPTTTASVALEGAT